MSTNSDAAPHTSAPSQGANGAVSVGWHNLALIKTDKREAATLYARLGLHPILLHGVLEGARCTCGMYPCGTNNKHAGKHPVMSGWQTAPLDTVALNQPTSLLWNVGLRMGLQPNGDRLLALDFDGPREMIAALEEQHGTLPDTLTSQSGSGVGSHAIFRVTANRTFRTKIRFTKLTLDICCGQIVAAPANHYSGGLYRWTNAREPAVLPESWQELLSVETVEAAPPTPRSTPLSSEEAGNIRAYLGAMPSSIQGENGSTACFKVARVLVHKFKLDDETAFRFLSEYNDFRATPPWSGKELWHKIRSAREKGQPFAEASTPAATTTALPRINATEIFAPLPAIDWLVQELDLCPGAVNLIAGYGYSGKTVTAMSLGFEVALGKSVWGRFPARQGKVLHLDFEQGRRLTLGKYQRLLTATAATPAELGDRLSIVSLCPMYLDTPGAEELLTRECEGHALLIVDSLRAACPTLEENDSRVRIVLDMLSRVSDRTGVTPIVIHHARKPNQDNKNGGAKMSIRGSGAIFDACASVLLLEARKGELVKVTHEKARASGIPTDDFSLRIEDVEIDGDLHKGLRVVADTVVAPAFAANTELAAKDSQVFALIAANPGANTRGLRGLARPMSNQIIDDAVGRLVASGRVSVTKGAHGSLEHRVVGSTVPPIAGPALNFPEPRTP